VQKKIRRCHLFERRPKCRDQRVWQAIDKPDGIGNQQLPAIG
jgi:hypothetical protein